VLALVSLLVDVVTSVEVVTEDVVSDVAGVAVVLVVSGTAYAAAARIISLVLSV
jgi:hypothetical protein